MKPLEGYKTGFDLPKVFHVKTSVRFNSTANPTLVTDNDLTDFGAIVLYMNHSSYNCPMHCAYCSDAYYPNGKCLSCQTVDQRY
jgi:hypothetical protein